MGNINILYKFQNNDILLSMEGEKFSGKHPYFDKIGNYDFDKLNLEVALNRTNNKEEVFYKGAQDIYNVVLINIFSDDKLIPQDIIKKNRKYYVIRYEIGDEFDSIESSDDNILVRKYILNSYYRARYAAIFYVDLPSL